SGGCLPGAFRLGPVVKGPNRFPSSLCARATAAALCRVYHMNRPTVFAAILNWNGARNTLRCVEHLTAQKYSSVNVVVIDNGSGAAELNVLRGGIPADCDVIDLPRNRGFAGGMNVGIRAAVRGYDFIWMLNNDAFPDPDCLGHLVRALESDDRLAAVTPLLYERDGREQHAGGMVNWATGENTLLSAAQMAESVQFGYWLTGTAPLFRTTALRD